MRHWHHGTQVDIGFRAGGALLCGLSYLAVRGLIAVQLSLAHGEPGVWAFMLAAAAYLCGSFGAVLLILGRHTLDEVEISPRWRTRSSEPTPAMPAVL